MNGIKDLDGQMNRQAWIMHAYDEFVCGNNVLYVPPDGKICMAIIIQPMDRWQTIYRFIGLCSLTGKIVTYQLDEYQDVLVINERT